MSDVYWHGNWGTQESRQTKFYVVILLSTYINTTIKTEDVCMCVCVSCLCRPPSHWWISFIFYTIVGLDPEGGQWLFKFKSNHNKRFNRQNAKQYMWDSSINWSRKHTNSDTVVGFENEMVSHAHARCTACKTLSRIHSRVRWFTRLTSVASVTRAPTL